MNCKKCGSILEPTDVACRNCGEPVGVLNAMPTAPTAQAAPVNSAPIPPAEPIQVAPVTPAPSPIPAQTVTPPINPVDESNMPRMATPVEPVPIPTPAAGVPTTPEMGMPVQPNVSSQTPVGVAPVGVVTNNAQTSMPEAVEPTKKKSSPIVVVLLLVVLIAVIAFIVIYLKKQLSPSTPANNGGEVVEEGTTDNTQTYNAWMNYLLSQNQVSITLTRKSEDLETGEKVEKATLSKDDLKTIFDKFITYPLVKQYLEKYEFTYGETLNITYGADGTTTNELVITNGSIEVPQDQDLLTAIEDSGYNSENDELKEKEGIIVRYYLNGYDSSIFDEYFAME